MTIEEEPGRKKQLLLIILFIPVPPLFLSLFLFLFLSFSCAFRIPACSYKFPFSLFKKNDTSNTWIHFCCKNSNRKLKSCLMRTLSLICPCSVHIFLAFYLYAFPSVPSLVFSCVFLIAYVSCSCYTAHVSHIFVLFTVTYWTYININIPVSKLCLVLHWLPPGFFTYLIIEGY